MFFVHSKLCHLTLGFPQIFYCMVRIFCFKFLTAKLHWLLHQSMPYRNFFTNYSSYYSFQAIGDLTMIKIMVSNDGNESRHNKHHQSLDRNLPDKVPLSAGCVGLNSFQGKKYNDMSTWFRGP